MKQHMSAAANRQAVLNGFVVYCWTARPAQVSSSTSTEDVTEWWTHVAVQGLKPWWPAFLLLQKVHDDDTLEEPSGNDMNAIEEVCTLQVRVEREKLLFIAGPALIQKLCLDWEWSLSVYHLSSRRRPFPDSHGRVRVLKKSEACTFWKGADSEKASQPQERRRQTKPRQPRAGGPLGSAAQDGELAEANDKKEERDGMAGVDPVDPDLSDEQHEGPGEDDDDDVLFDFELEKLWGRARGAATVISCGGPGTRQWWRRH